MNCGKSTTKVGRVTSANASIAGKWIINLLLQLRKNEILSVTMVAL